MLVTLAVELASRVMQCALWVGDNFKIMLQLPAN